MAEINVKFNDIDYTLDENVFNSASSALKSHIQNKLTGSGKTITFNDIGYSVDSVKLTAATDKFVSHLITISGNGPKLHLNGIDYSVNAVEVEKTLSSITEFLNDVEYPLMGHDGKSGYQLAKEAGFIGTFDDFIATFNGTSHEKNAGTLKELLTLKHDLRVDAEGNFKILTFSDVQCSSDDPNNKYIKEAAANIEAIVAREAPDFVMLLGDNSYGMNYSDKLRNYLSIIMAPVESRQIPWAHVYGNHDDETVYTAAGNVWYAGIDKLLQQPIYESFNYCVSKDTKVGYDGKELFGVGNFVLPVMSTDGTKVEFNIWGIDSGAYIDAPIANKKFSDGNEFYGKYEYIQKNQIDWYNETSALLERYNGGKIYGMMAFHIPLQETYTAWKEKENLNLEWEGEKRENISACAVNSGLFNSIKERGDIKLIANGHDHLNDFMVKYDDIRFCYNAAVGTEVYHAVDMLGGRVINFNKSISDDFDTHMSYVQERTADNPLFIMSIDNDNTVYNSSYINSLVKYPLPITYKTQNGPAVTISYDETISGKYLSFAGGATPCAYNVPANKINNVISDGFSYEVLFRVNNGNISTNYVGILDTEEAGGFGLNLYKNSSNINKPSLKADLAYASTWNTLSYPINVGEWYHCVYSFDGTNVALYINGEIVQSGTVTGAYRPPTFSQRTGEEYICIGACAAAWNTDTSRSTGISGFIGDIAICNLYPSSTAAATAKEYYNTAKKRLTSSEATALLLDLNIDAAAQTVTNGAPNGVALEEVTHANSSKLIYADANIGMDAVKFTPRGLWATTDAYTLPTSTLDAKLNDGFSVELYFNIDNVDNVGSSYVGILNYEEGGGFGLDLVKSNTAGKANIQLEIAYWDSANSKNAWLAPYTTEVDMNKWVHCVFTYTGPDNGNKIYLYVDGQLKYSTTLLGNYNQPSAFTSAPYIAIGACAQSGTIAQNGFAGSLAICRIYSKPLNESETLELYNQVI